MKVNRQSHSTSKFTMEKGKKRKSSPPRWREIAVNLPGGSALMRRVREQKIVDSWKEAVGAGVAEQTQPKRVRNQILEVQVSNSVWIQQLQFMKKLIIKKLHEKAGFDFLQDIRFFIGEVGHMDKKESLQESPSPLSKSEQEKIMKEVSGVQDPEMQNILSGLYSRALTLKRNRMEKRKNKP